MWLATRSALAIFTVLISVMPARGECAWVLWEKVTRLDAKRRVVKQTWELLKASASANSCNGDRVERWVRLSRPDSGGTADILSEQDTRVLFSQSDGGTLQRHPVCFPDTIDPRGPKGR